MLQVDGVEIDGKVQSFYPELRSTKDLSVALQFWMAYVARDLLQLGVFFRAAAIMSQVPGVRQYAVVHYDDVNDDVGDDEEDPSQWVGEADRETVFNVLADCLRRVEAEDLIEQVPGAGDYEREELSDEWKEYLDRTAKIEHGVLNVVAECLDDLMVRPGIAEIGAASRPTWWQQLWGKL
jgi:hypothetical protein